MLEVRVPAPELTSPIDRSMLDAEATVRWEFGQDGYDEGGVTLGQFQQRILDTMKGEEFQRTLAVLQAEEKERQRRLVVRAVAVVSAGAIVWRLLVFFQ